MTKLTEKALRSTLIGLVAFAIASPAHAAGSLNLIPDGGLLIVLLIAFGALIFPLNALLFRPLFRVLDERDDRIAGARQRAESLQVEADSALQRYGDSIREVREEAEGDRRGLLDAARGEQSSIAATAREQATEEIERARDSLAASLEEARTGLRDEAVSLSRQVAERVLGRTLS